MGWGLIPATEEGVLDTSWSQRTCVAGPYPFSLRAAIRKITAGFELRSKWAVANVAEVTVAEGDWPQYTRTNAIPDGVEPTYR